VKWVLGAVVGTNGQSRRKAVVARQSPARPCGQRDGDRLDLPGRELERVTDVYAGGHSSRSAARGVCLGAEWKKAARDTAAVGETGASPTSLNDRALLPGVRHGLKADV
jgi:hypothetical protein